MNTFLELLACPTCGKALAPDWSCRACGARYEAPDGIPNLRVSGDSMTDLVRRFYEESPFPGYPPRDSLSWLRARAERSEFVRLLDQAIPGDARIVEIGCGTGQMSLYLARAERVVIGADLTRGALQLGAAAAKRFGLDRVRFVETTCNILASVQARLMWFMHQAFCTTPRIRDHPFPELLGLRGQAESSFSVFTILSLAYHSACAECWRVGRDIDGSRSIRSYAIAGMNRRDGRRGCGTSIKIQKSTAILSLKFKNGSRKTESTTCARIPPHGWARNPGICSLTLPITGCRRPGWRSWAGFPNLVKRVGCSSLLASVASHEWVADILVHVEPCSRIA